MSTVLGPAGKEGFDQNLRVEIPQESRSQGRSIMFAAYAVTYLELTLHITF